jgi:hypothetical protein
MSVVASRLLAASAKASGDDQDVLPGARRL